MQKDIQPKYEAIKVSCACGNIFEAGSVKDEIKVEICSECQYEAVEVKCACGNTFQAGSVKDEIKVEICSECHPFYTGKQKNIEKGGRIDKFKKRFKMD